MRCSNEDPSVPCVTVDGVRDMPAGKRCLRRHSRAIAHRHLEIDQRQASEADGSSSDLYGAAPLGQLIYDSHGHMSVHLATPDLTKCGTLDRRKCPDGAARSAFDNYLGYWGHFKVTAGGKSVMHIIEGASTPDWIGTSQERFFELSGDRLTLTTPMQQIAGVESKTVLVWQREK
jgi:Lipocalin-like domain